MTKYIISKSYNVIKETKFLRKSKDLNLIAEIFLMKNRLRIGKPRADNKIFAKKKKQEEEEREENS